MDKELDLPMNDNEEQKTVVLDIRSILEQLGIEKERWPDEWFGREKVEQSSGNPT